MLDTTDTSEEAGTSVAETPASLDNPSGTPVGMTEVGTAVGVAASPKSEESWERMALVADGSPRIEVTSSKDGTEVACGTNAEMSEAMLESGRPVGIDKAAETETEALGALAAELK